MAWLVGTSRERAGRAERGRRPTAGLRVQNADAESKHISLSLSLVVQTTLASLADVSPLAVQCNPASASTKCRDFLLNGTSQVATTRPHLTSRYPRQGVVLSCYHVLTRPRHI